MKKVRFILNPISGRTPADPEELASYIQINFPGADMRLTKAPGHATQLAQEAHAQRFEAVIAIGGDGTINEVAKGLVDSQTALGVIPRGSGNGFARMLGMPTQFAEAVMRLQRGEIKPCDVGTANREIFLNVAGIGLESEIAYRFMQHGKTGCRGKWPYFKLGAQTVFAYRPEVLEIELNGQTRFEAPLTLVFANGQQYGSNFKIAPQASLCDGKLDMVSIADAPKWKLALALPYFFTAKPRPFDLVKTEPVEKVILRRGGQLIYHVDGEPRRASEQLEIAVKPAALRVIFPEP